MTHEDQSTRFEELLQLLSDHGFDGMAEAKKQRLPRTGMPRIQDEAFRIDGSRFQVCLPAR